MEFPTKRYVRWCRADTPSNAAMIAQLKPGDYVLVRYVMTDAYDVHSVEAVVAPDAYHEVAASDAPFSWPSSPDAYDELGSYESVDCMRITKRHRCYAQCAAWHMQAAVDQKVLVVPTLLDELGFSS